MKTAKNPKMPKFVKVSEIDYKILILKNKDSPLSEKEKERLDSLTEQKSLQESCGLKLNKTAKIPSHWISDDETSCNAPKTTSSRLESFRETSKSVKIDELTDVVEVNGSMELGAGKLGASNGSDCEKTNKLSEKAQQNKLLRDKFYQKQKREAKAREKDQVKVNLEKLKNIIAAKIEKKPKVKTLGEQLQSRLTSLQIETQAVDQLIKEREKSVVLMKEKYKLVYKHHNKCLQNFKKV